MADFGKLLHQNFKKLAEAGCKHIQIDEPYFTPSSDDEVAAAVDAINMAIEGLPEDVHVHVHICQGNYAVGPDYDGQIGHRYFDVGRYKADLVCRIDCDGYLIEHDMTPHYEELLGDKQLGVGAVDVQAPNVETGEQVAERIRAHRWLAPEQTIITSSCGFNHLPRHIALGKLRAMTEAKAILSGMQERQRYAQTANQRSRLQETLRAIRGTAAAGGSRQRHRHVRSGSCIRAIGRGARRSQRCSFGHRTAERFERQSQLHGIFVDDAPEDPRRARGGAQSGQLLRGIPGQASGRSVHWLAGKGRTDRTDAEPCCGAPSTTSPNARRSKRGCLR